MSKTPDCFVRIALSCLRAILILPLEQFLIKCRESKTNQIATTYQKKGKYLLEPMRTQSENSQTA